MAKKKSYQEAYDELVEIVKELEDDTISIDQMSGKVKKAAELIRACKEKLKVTEEEVAEILQELQGGEGQ
ncbi:exodeoxyribonuclease VII small subunit [Bacteroidales bacterium OttesenSCG-928-J16]|nr:exodeoxyribonuclease VII small subunit [Bacteroidales bacterium OttesenSCG-928-J16]